MKTFSTVMARSLARRAVPACAECDGTGITLAHPPSAPTQIREIACACVTRDEPADDPDAWSGGFSSNH